MNLKRVLKALAGLAMLKFFPANNEAVLAALARLVVNMCENEQQVEWLVDRMTSGLYAEWPGPQEMRACFCSRYKPKDGINAYSTVYLDGIPASKPLALPPAPVLALPPGKRDEVGDQVFRDFASEHKARRRAEKLATLPPLNSPITDDDVARAIQAREDAKRRLG